MAKAVITPKQHSLHPELLVMAIHLQKHVGELRMNMYFTHLFNIVLDIFLKCEPFHYLEKMGPQPVNHSWLLLCILQSKEIHGPGRLCSYLKDYFWNFVLISWAAGRGFFRAHKQNKQTNESSSQPTLALALVQFFQIQIILSLQENFLTCIIRTDMQITIKFFRSPNKKAELYSLFPY